MIPNCPPDVIHGHARGAAAVIESLPPDCLIIYAQARQWRVGCTIGRYTVRGAPYRGIRILADGRYTTIRADRTVWLAHALVPAEELGAGQPPAQEPPIAEAPAVLPADPARPAAPPRPLRIPPRRAKPVTQPEPGVWWVIVRALPGGRGESIAFDRRELAERFDLPPDAPDRPVSRVASSRPPLEGADGLLRFPPPRHKYAYHDDRAQARR